MCKMCILELDQVDDRCENLHKVDIMLVRAEPLSAEMDGDDEVERI